MKRLLIAALFALPMGILAQTTLTPQEQLEQAQRQLQEAQAALEQAKANIEAARLRETGTATNATVLPTPTQPATTTVPVESTATPATKLTLPGGSAKTEDEDMSRYLVENAVPVVDGYVTWTADIAAPGNTAQQVYDKLLTATTQLTQGSDQLEGSRVAQADGSKHAIMATMREWLTFTSSFLSLDRSEFSYVLSFDCQDGGARLTMTRLKYVYTQQNEVDRYNAEEWITDKVAVNKKHTRLFRITGKFRRATIDRKDALVKYFNDAIKLL